MVASISHNPRAGESWVDVDIKWSPLHFQLLAAYLSSSTNLCFPLWIKQTRPCRGFFFPSMPPLLEPLYAALLCSLSVPTAASLRTNCRKLHYGESSCPKNHNLQQSGSPLPSEEQMQRERCYQRRPYPQDKLKYPNATPLPLSLFSKTSTF